MERFDLTELAGEVLFVKRNMTGHTMTPALAGYDLRRRGPYQTVQCGF
jgi:hypothetical protein